MYGTLSSTHSEAQLPAERQNAVVGHALHDTRRQVQRPQAGRHGGDVQPRQHHHSDGGSLREKRNSGHRFPCSSCVDGCKSIIPSCVPGPRLIIEVVARTWFSTVYLSMFIGRKVAHLLSDEVVGGERPALAGAGQTKYEDEVQEQTARKWWK